MAKELCSDEIYSFLFEGKVERSSDGENLMIEITSIIFIVRNVIIIIIIITANNCDVKRRLYENRL